MCKSIPAQKNCCKNNESKFYTNFCNFWQIENQKQQVKCHDKKPAKTTRLAKDDTAAEGLWALSEKLCGITKTS